MKALLIVLAAAFTAPAFAVSIEECDGYVSNNLRYGCYADLLDQEDARLNANYQEVKRVAQPALFAKIQTAQRTWIKYRDEDCAARKDVLKIIGLENGAVVCVALKTKTRADELEQYAELLNENTEGNETE